jgi:hypothetical protein
MRWTAVGGIVLFIAAAAWWALDQISVAKFAMSDFPEMFRWLAQHPAFYCGPLAALGAAAIAWDIWLRDSFLPHLTVSIVKMREPLDGCQINSAAKVWNRSGTNYEKVLLALVENVRHNGMPVLTMPDQIVLRTEGQIKQSRAGRFHLSGKSGKNLPILWRKSPNGQPHFKHETGTEYTVPFKTIEFELAVVGANFPVRETFRVTINGADVKSEIVS